MKKRNLFAEITEGFDALAEERAGKRTLRTHAVETLPAPDVSAGNCSPCASACAFRGRCSRVTCAPIRARWRTGNRAGRSRTRKRPC